MKVADFLFVCKDSHCLHHPLRRQLESGKVFQNHHNNIMKVYCTKYLHNIQKGSFPSYFYYTSCLQTGKKALSIITSLLFIFPLFLRESPSGNSIVNEYNAREDSLNYNLQCCRIYIRVYFTIFREHALVGV